MSGAEVLAGFKVAGSIVGVLSQACDYARGYRKYSKSLRRIATTLRRSHRKLARWYKYWGLAFDKEGHIFKALWGEKDFRQLRSDLHYAVNQCIKCTERLRSWCSIEVPLHELPGDDDSSIYEELGIDPANLRDVNTNDTGTFQRICGYMFKGDALLNDAEDTAKLIDSLTLDTEAAFEDQGFGKPTDSAHVDSCRNMIRMRRLAARLYKEFYPYRDEFEVLLRLFWPDLKNECQHWQALVRKPRIEFVILTLRPDEAGVQKRQVVRQCSIAAHPTKDDVKPGNKTDDIDMGTFCKLSGRLSFMFESEWYIATEITGRVGTVRSVQDTFGNKPLKDLPDQQDRMHSAKVLATIIVWYSVLPDSRWFEMLHGSGLLWTHFVGYEQDRPNFGQFDGAAKYVFRPWIAQGASRPALTHPRAGLTCLVSVVSELVLQRRVECVYQNGQPVFTVSGWNRGRTRDHFLEDVTAAGGDRVGEALAYCLTPDRRHIHVDGRTIKVEHFATNAVNPLFAFHREMMQSTTGGIPLRPA